ncbi:hypothetical protein HJFPF1_05565 [Paramyrothecium foliicola]|nr:hypothetical protein HJFPF1_05565 [Paramyrothecium foliicola]
MDSCLPEMLARDLESSKGLFAAKNMTAGAPSSKMALSDESGSVASQPVGPAASPLQYPHIPPRVQSLRSIREKFSMVSFLDQRDSTNYDMKSESDASSDTELSGAAEAPFVSFRQQSITTAPTSVASTQRRASPRNSPTLIDSRGCSWIDGDSDYEMALDFTVDRFACLSPRPPTPPETSGGPVKGMAPRGTRRHSHTIPQPKILSAACAPSRSPERRLSIRSEDTAMRRSSSLRSDSFDGGASTIFNLAPFSSNQSKPGESELEKQPSPLTLPPSVDAEPHNMASLQQVTTFDSRLDEDDYPDRGRNCPRPQTIYIQPSPPPSPLPSVQSWVCSNSQPYASQFANDELAKAVPLPPNIIETLRVSIACFPETMLLTSSLTIETIRSYSKKVRHSPVETMRGPFSDNLQQPPRKSIWKKVVSYRRGSPSPDRRRSSSMPIDKSSFQSPSATSLEVVKPWASLQSVFGSTSDYLCDALYAHIIAYNYISALVPRTPPSKPRRNSHVQGELQHEDIPKKAASLLGLGSVVDVSSPSAPSLFKTIGSSFLKDAPAGQATLPASYEHAIREIQAGLMRCIARLVATARLVAESGTGEERLVEMGASEVDMLLTRSLCEVVRLSEENTPGY